MLVEEKPRVGVRKVGVQSRLCHLRVSEIMEKILIPLGLKYLGLR